MALSVARVSRTSARDAQATLVSASGDAATQIKSLSADVERTLSAAGTSTAGSIVAGAREDHDPRAVDTAGSFAQQGPAHRGEPGRRPLHERPFRELGHERGFRRPDLSYLVSVTHDAY